MQMNQGEKNVDVGEYKFLSSSSLVIDPHLFHQSSCTPYLPSGDPLLDPTPMSSY